MIQNLEDQSPLDPEHMLKWYVECGVDECISDNTTNWFEEQDKTSLKQIVTPNQPTAQKRQAVPTLASNKDIIIGAEKVAAACTNLEELNQAILSFEGCSLKNTASNTVFSDGNRSSQIMVIGEAPGDLEDKIGKPFISEDEGLLLDKMFAAIDLSREKDFYITNVIPWRPPGNRKPTDSECAMCLPFLKRHIELFNPKLIITIGGVSASYLLNEKAGITKLRGSWKEYEVNDQSNKIPLMPLLHPAYLIKHPHYKKQTWHDLLNIKERLASIIL